MCLPASASVRVSARESLPAFTHTRRCGHGQGHRRRRRRAHSHVPARVSASRRARCRRVHAHTHQASDTKANTGAARRRPSRQPGVRARSQ
eukprot:7602933-Alexandrium_andersonii.AAC.1